ncbi:9210_t:CDS:2 [Diversispora eburnea]|uniref:9210_t:CDS:1 n=1 Tax=Diversispora eburnea TaxID=1213867 RepID=A0A9N9BLP6_9GLOM|nr:9210_t:CDS:2 [Diversispora eburnea]
MTTTTTTKKDDIKFILSKLDRAYDALFKGMILDPDITRSKINLPCKLWDHEYKLSIEKNNHYDENDERIILDEDNILSKSSSPQLEIYEDICKEVASCWVWVKMVTEVFNEKLYFDPKSKKFLKRIGDGKSLLEIMEECRNFVMKEDIFNRLTSMISVEYQEALRKSLNQYFESEAYKSIDIKTIDEETLFVRHRKSKHYLEITKKFLLDIKENPGSYLSALKDLALRFQ